MSDTKTLTVKVVGDTRDAASSLSKLGNTSTGTTSKMGKLGSAMSTTGKVIAGVGFAAAGYGLYKLGGAMIGGVQDAEAHQRALGVAASQIKVTGKAANVTVKDVENLSSKLEDQTGIDEDLITQSQSLLLSYKGIANAGKGANAVFDRTAKSALDLSTVMGVSVPSATNMLGKALNDPATGMSKLTRVGVTFTKQQQKQITTLSESGKTLKAQKLMLKAVEGQVGGASKAANEGFTGSLNKLKDTVADFFRDAMEPLLPVLQKAAKWLSDGIPKAVAAVKAKFEEMKPTIDRVKNAFMTVIEFLQNNKDILPSIAIAIGVVTVALGALAVIQAIVAATNPFVLIIVGITALIAGLIYAYKHFETFRNVVQVVFGVVKVAFNVIKTVVMVAIKVIVGAIKLWWKQLQVMVGIVKAVWDKVSGVFKWVVGFIRGYFRLYWGIIKGAWNLITGVFNTAKDAVVRIVSALWDKVKSAFDSAKSRLIGAVKAIWAGIKTVFIEWPAKALQYGKDLIQGLIDGVGAMWDTVVSYIGSLGTAMLDKIKGIFRIGSPSKVFISIGKFLMQGLGLGIKKNAKYPLDRLAEAADAMVAKAKQKYNDLLSAQRDFHKSLADNGKSFGSISNVFSTDEGASNTTQDFVGRMRARLGDIRLFFANLKALSKRGLNKSILREIMGMGVEGGLDITKALVSGGGLKELNQVSRSIDKTSNRLGKWSGNVFYGDQVKDSKHDLAKARSMQAKIKRLEHAVKGDTKVYVTVQGNVTSERDLAKAIHTIIRDQNKRDDKRNGRN